MPSVAAVFATLLLFAGDAVSLKSCPASTRFLRIQSSAVSCSNNKNGKEPLSFSSKIDVVDKLAALTVALSLGLPDPSQAQIPSFDDYNAGNSGTVVRDAGEKTKGNVDMAKTSSKSVSAAKSATLNCFISSTVPEYLASSKDMANKGMWKELIALNKLSFRIVSDSDTGTDVGESAGLSDNNKSSRLVIIKKPFFGGSNVGFIADSLKVSTKTATEMESLREDLAFTLGQIEDVAVSNQVYFFNKEDLTQVKRIINQAGDDVDMDEAKSREMNDLERFKNAVAEASGLIPDAQESAAKMQRLLK